MHRSFSLCRINPLYFCQRERGGEKTNSGHIYGIFHWQYHMHASILSGVMGKTPLNVKTLCCCKSPSLYTIHNLSSLSTPPPLYSLSLSLAYDSEWIVASECAFCRCDYTHQQFECQLFFDNSRLYDPSAPKKKKKKKNFHFEAQPKRSTHTINISILYAKLYFNCGQMVNKSERGAE